MNTKQSSPDPLAPEMIDDEETIQDLMEAISLRGEQNDFFNERINDFFEAEREARLEREEFVASKF